MVAMGLNGCSNHAEGDSIGFFELNQLCLIWHLQRPALPDFRTLVNCDTCLTQ
jgi:hypothetical protein